jgi:putative endonuclease
MPDARPWYLYLLLCRNGACYAGITNDLDARFRAHANGTGARYTRANPPVGLLGSRVYPDRAAASRAEWQIKRLPKERKLAFLQADTPDAAPPTDITGAVSA